MNINCNRFSIEEHVLTAATEIIQYLALTLPDKVNFYTCRILTHY